MKLSRWPLCARPTRSGGF